MIRRINSQSSAILWRTSRFTDVLRQANDCMSIAHRLVGRKNTQHTHTYIHSPTLLTPYDVHACIKLTPTFLAKCSANISARQASREAATRCIKNATDVDTEVYRRKLGFIRPNWTRSRGITSRMYRRDNCGQPAFTGNDRKKRPCHGTGNLLDVNSTTYTVGSHAASRHTDRIHGREIQQLT